MGSHDGRKNSIFERFFRSYFGMHFGTDFCSIFGRPKRLDSWLGLCLGLFLRFLGCFRCHFWSAQCPPALFCSIFGGPNRLDLWLDLCLKLLFDCQNPLKVTNGVAGDINRESVVIFARLWEADHPLITKKHPRNPPICGHTCGANCGADFWVVLEVTFGRQGVVVYEVFSHST